MYYKDKVFKTLEERTENEYPWRDGIIDKMISPALRRNETVSKFLDGIDEIFIERVLDIKRTQNLIRPAVKENDA